MMRMRCLLVTAILLLLCTSVAAAEKVAGLPLHVQELAPGAIRVWIGDHISSTAIVAFATAKGIVVVDTLGLPKADAALRPIIARELGRSDFAYLINTHEHGDHTWGNGVYADCTIVGHSLCGAGMRANAGDRQRLIGWYSNRITELEGEVSAQPGDSTARASLEEQLVLARLTLDMLSSSVDLVQPTVTFADRMTIDMGDTTFELYYTGGMHSSSDIAVFVPEHGLLMTGDTMADIWLTDTPGCLASFTAREGVTHDFPRLLANWGALLAKGDAVKDLIPGHWNGDLTPAGFEARYGYVKALWEGVQAAATDRRGLVDLFAAYRLATRFPDLVDSPGFDARNTTSTIAEMWSTATGQTSAATQLYALIDEGASESALREIVAERGASSPKYYFLEAQINGNGYRFLQENKLEQAVALFKLNVELFPEAWNVYDSYGEALLRSGDAAAAVAMYEKSVALNPDNANAREVLDRIRSSAADE